ncbi:HNH endonuclease [Shimia marina]|uniref:Putative restriction endonuclease n=1 Tax=Shimia marina TaxID=321267 RepID=A0A0P1FE01_9RHOB|nr:HNH endonuclease [Shimia marina]CUH52993.1 putative restriction endonuclease [Shimia marina]SFD91956.1 5-methylcytosine-specific restriction enzyme A [Shimia marina]
MSIWQEKASELDELYSQEPEIARRQLKNQVQLLVLEGTDHRFFPIRRLADGMQGMPMNSARSEAAEIIRYRSQLEADGFVAVRQDSKRHDALMGTLCELLGEQFATKPSLSKKTFWIKAETLRDEVVLAFQAYDEYGTPEGFRDAKKWFVLHPETFRYYPAKIIWGLTTDEKGRDFTAHQARDALRKLDFQCVDRSRDEVPASSESGKFYEGAETLAVQSLRERNTAARVRCIAYHRHMNNGKLACAVCGFDFTEVYGELGEGFINVHHLHPMSEAKSERQVVPEKDLVPVCPNCHAMIHRGGMTRTLDDMREIVKKGRIA